jgi:hypothetical protein
MDPEIAAVGRRLVRLARRIRNGKIPTATRLWGGAHVVISEAAPEVSASSWEPEHRHVVTEFGLELSWLFDQLRNAFGPTIGGPGKFEFYGRLANAANAYLNAVHSKEQTARDLAMSSLLEAFVMLDEMGRGDFVALNVAIGNEIADDRVERAPYPEPQVVEMSVRHYESIYVEP